MIVRGDTLYILELEPAGYAYYAANEAEKASHINIVNVSGFGKFGRVYIAGDEAEVIESKVIVEARESGKGVGIFDSSGAVSDSEVDEIVAGVKDVNDLVWEAPIKNQYQYLILRFGNNVNLGNIPADDILALEALRSGLRGDTLKRALERGVKFTG